jgi:cytochrome P450
MTVYANHPEEWAALAADDSLAPAAVDEVMRVAGVVSAIPRITTEAVELEGYDIPAGTFMTLLLSGANRDPDAFTSPDRFDPTALRPDSQVGFGGGAHHCLGANLARAEMQEALPRLARAMPGMRVVEPPRWRSPLGGIAGPLELNLAFAAP